MPDTLLAIEHLRAVFDTAAGPAVAVDDVCLTVDRGQTLALVGESGCGKTVLALSCLGLLSPPGRVATGRAIFDGRDLLALPERERRTIRGRRAAMIFQEPMTALNPVLTIGDQVSEPARVHKHLSRRQALEAAAAMLAQVGLPDPTRRLASQALPRPRVQ